MATFVLAHRHGAEECPVAYASWKGFASPLRHRSVVASCASGGHRMYWLVEAREPQAALDLVPPYLRDRTEVTEVSAVMVP